MTNKLSDIPSELLRLGLIDFEECENDSRYVINFGFFHYPQKDGCYIDFVGAVMAKTLKLPLDERVHYPKDKFHGPDLCRLEAIVELIAGHVEYGLSNFNILAPNSCSVRSHKEWIEYEDDPELFKYQTCDLIGKLQAEGL